MTKRRRRVGSVRNELLIKSREASLLAIQCFNNPLIGFKSEVFIVMNNIAWTYLMHAYYRSKGIDYRYFSIINARKKYDRTKRGAFKYWELERCLNHESSPLDKATSANLRFLIGIRHEIEHQMTTSIDDLLSAKFQAACLNINFYYKSLFGEKYAIDKYLTFSLQLSGISQEQIDGVSEHRDLPQNIESYLEAFERDMTEEEFADPRYSYRILFIPKMANRKGQADRVIEFVKADDPLAKEVNVQYTVIKEQEKKKYRPKTIIAMMKDLGYRKFSMHYHTDLWKSMNAKSDSKFGVLVEGDWFWYEPWIDIVKDHCRNNAEKYQ